MSANSPTEFNSVPTVKWCGITVTRVWRRGNRGNVASALIEKIACGGDFLPILDAGYNLQYSSLMEYRVVVFCQMDVNRRAEAHPAAEVLAANLLQPVFGWKPGAARTGICGQSGRNCVLLVTARSPQKSR